MKIAAQITCFLLLIFCYVQATAGNENVPVGARANGLGGAAVTISDVWALSNNTAALATLKNPELAAYAENRFTIKEFNTVALLAVYPIHEKYGTVGIEFNRFGDNIYNEQRFGLGYGHTLGFVSLGLKADLVQVHVEEIGIKRTVALSFGGLAKISDKIHFGAHVYNFNQAKLADEEDERVPTIMKAGLSYRPNSKLMINLESEKNIEFDAEFKAGVEYKFIEKFAARAGFSTLNESVSLGAGWHARVFEVNYAVNLLSTLGPSNHLSISYTFL